MKSTPCLLNTNFLVFKFNCLFYDYVHYLDTVTLCTKGEALTVVVGKEPMLVNGMDESNKCKDETLTVVIGKQPCTVNGMKASRFHIP